jgi:methyl-accepting chemotaxis protein
VLGEELVLFEQMTEAADRLDRDVREQAERQVAAARENSDRTRTSLLVAALLALLLAGGLAVLITRSLTRPLARAVDVLKSVAGGDLSPASPTPRATRSGRWGPPSTRRSTR